MKTDHNPLSVISLLTLGLIVVSCQNQTVDLSTFQIHPDFTIELAAGEPLVFDPVEMEFDETGFALFTSGVWESDGAMVSSIGASNLIVEPHGRPPDKERQANLALIAQAPAMYELLIKSKIRNITCGLACLTCFVNSADSKPLATNNTPIPIVLYVRRYWNKHSLIYQNSARSMKSCTFV